MNKLDKNDLLHFESNDINSLYEILGKSLSASDDLELKGHSRFDYQYIGQDFFQKQINLIQEKICSKDFQDKLKNNDDIFNLVTLVADTLSPIFSGIPLLSISWLIVKIGIHKICRK